MLGVAVEAMQKAGASYEDIAAIGITNQREDDDRLGQKRRRAGLQRHRMAVPQNIGILRFPDGARTG